MKCSSNCRLRRRRRKNSPGRHRPRIFDVFVGLPKKIHRKIQIFSSGAFPDNCKWLFSNRGIQLSLSLRPHEPRPGPIAHTDRTSHRTSVIPFFSL
jgi:hypothetical protein